MIQGVLVPLDGSPFSEQSIPVAVEIARRAGASLQLVTVHEPLPPVLMMGGTPVRAPDTRSDFESYLRVTADRVRTESGLDVGFALLEGSPAESLGAMVAERGVDLIVMTTHGRSGASRLWLGSVAESVVRHVTVPVLLVKQRGGSVSAFRKVLVALDGTPLAESVIESAVDIAGKDGVEYTIVRVVEPMTSLSAATLGALPDPSPELWTEERKQVDNYLDSVADRLRARSLVVHVRSRVHTHAGRGLLEAAGDMSADLIAISTHGRTGFKRVLLGSVADKVLRGAETSVLLRRPPDV
jgi:nucleotide-binding universal stress UspA family protein